MTRLRHVLARLLLDEAGGGVIESALVAGLVAVGTIAAVTAFGAKVLARWSGVSDAPL